MKPTTEALQVRLMSLENRLMSLENSLNLFKDEVRVELGKIKERLIALEIRAGVIFK